MPVGTTPPEDMTLAELKAEFDQLAGEISTIETRRAKLRKEYKKRVNLTAMQKRINKLTPGQKEAARQILCT